MLWIALVVCIPVISAINDSFDALWKAYQVEFGKRYDAREERGRRLVWERNALKIARHNLEADLGLQSYRMALNKFADKTPEELEMYRRCFSPQNGTVHRNGFYRTRSGLDLPSFVDWRLKGLVTPVKDQGDCGSCWAFSATGSLEGQNKVKTGKLVSLSEQNLVDCSWKQGNDGCDGGWMEYAFQYVMDNRGLDTEEAYPYRVKDGRCKFRREGVGVNCTGYHRVKEGSESALQVAVGPISVAIDAGENFMFYESGIFSDRTCSPADLDHAVLVVGYGSQDGVDYWIVKNSWGSQWGLDGYILMSRNAGNQCGIASHAVFPSV